MMIKSSTFDCYPYIGVDFTDAVKYVSETFKKNRALAQFVSAIVNFLFRNLFVCSVCSGIDHFIKHALSLLLDCGEAVFSICGDS